MATLTYLGANWLLVVIAVLAVAVLGTIAFFSKNVWIAVAAGALVVAGLMYQNAVTTGIKLEMAKETERQLAALQSRLNALQNANEEYAKQAEADAKKIEELEISANETPPNSTPCLDRDAVRRLRAIQ